MTKIRTWWKSKLAIGTHLVLYGYRVIPIERVEGRSGEGKKGRSLLNSQFGIPRGRSLDAYTLDCWERDALARETSLYTSVLYY